MPTEVKIAQNICTNHLLLLLLFWPCDCSFDEGWKDQQVIFTFCVEHSNSYIKVQIDNKYNKVQINSNSSLTNLRKIDLTYHLFMKRVKFAFTTFFRCRVSFPFLILHSSFSFLYSPYLILHSSFSISHSHLFILHSSFSFLHSPLPIPHSPFPIPHSPWRIVNDSFCSAYLAIHALIVSDYRSYLYVGSYLLFASYARN